MFKAIYKVAQGGGAYYSSLTQPKRPKMELI